MSEQAVTRKLAAIVLADIVGYSRLMGADEEGTLDAVRTLRTELIEPKVVEFRGRIVKTTGDGILLEFASVVDAVRCFADIQNGVATNNAGRTDDRHILYRVGVNIGDVIVEGDDLYGDGVNVAARIEGLAEAGGIALSDDAYRQVRDRLEIGWSDGGEHEVKNIARPIRVWHWSSDAKPVTTRSPVSAGGAPALPDKPAIAVLPFTNMSGDPEQEYFADGITDDLITALSNVHSFFVIARNSTFVYKGQAVDVKDVASALGVHYVMEGSVRKAGNRVRVSAQLIEAESGSHVWADHYDGALDDIFDLQDEITTNVVGAIEPELLRAEAGRIGQKHPDSLDAYDLTLRGLALMNRLTPEDTAEAQRLFTAATKIDPSYGRAYVCASWCHRRQVQIQGMVLTDEQRAEAVRLAKEALRLDDNDPYVLWHAGTTVLMVEQDIDAGLQLIDRSLAVNPSANRAWLASAIARCIVGDPETAITDAERAMRLSPLDTSKWVANGMLATAYMQLKRYEDSADRARQSVRQHIFNAPAHHVLAASCAHLGRMDEAREAMRHALELDREMSITRLQNIYQVARYKNIDGFLSGLRQAGMPE